VDAQGRPVTRAAALVIAIVALLFGPRNALAHVGSPNAIFEGRAGPNLVHVVVRPADVVPGLAEITVRVLEGNPRRVTVQPIWWNAPTQGGAPPPDDATPVRGADRTFAGHLWIMVSGSHAVRVSVESDSGSGDVLVPVTAVATRRNAMPTFMAALLIVFAIVLVGGAVAIVRAAAGEATVPSDDVPETRARRRGWGAAVLAAVVLAAVVFGLGKWWRAIDQAYVAHLHHVPRTSASVRTDGEEQRLELTLDEPLVSQDSFDDEHPPRPVVIAPDHGKLMHMFLVREPSLDAFAHLHPVPMGSAKTSFETTLPRLPAGRYRVYADVTDETGFAQTLTSAVTLPEPRGNAPLADPDDSWHVSSALGAPDASAASVSLGDGLTMRWDRSRRLVAGEATSLQFRVDEANGTVAELEPYMGMAAHAAIRRDDGQVVVHVHPTGTISMASQRLFEKRRSGEPAAGGDEHAMHHHPIALEGRMTIPYEFPQPGRYRIWVQVKVAGAVRTGVFDTTVDG
jgi:hypothetical protein